MMICRWRSGRLDSDKPTEVPDGRLPDADKGCIGKTIGHVRDIFYRMGFNDR
jgi:cytochrome c peroxidase